MPNKTLSATGSPKLRFYQLFKKIYVNNLHKNNIAFNIFID